MALFFLDIRNFTPLIEKHQAIDVIHIVKKRGAREGELFPYLFPYDKDLFLKIAKDGAESRFHAGIHFRSDNDAGLELGRKVAAKVIEKLKADGAEGVGKVVRVSKK